MRAAAPWGLGVLLFGCGQPSGEQAPGPVQVDVDAGSCVHPRVESRCHDGFCLLPAGCFKAGSPADEPGRGRYSEEIRDITLTHPFLLAQHELTQAEWVQAGFPNLAGTTAT